MDNRESYDGSADDTASASTKLTYRIMCMFIITNDIQSMRFCEDIVSILRTQFHLSEYVAKKYVAMQWEGQFFEGEYDMRYHELPLYWANHIYKYHEYLFGDA